MSDYRISTCFCPLNEHSKLDDGRDLLGVVTLKNKHSRMMDTVPVG